MFREIRKDAVSRGSNLPQMSRLFFTDRKYNLYSLYRSAHSIDYSDLRKKRAKAILFPGCALGTFHPTLTRELYKNLAKDEPDLSIFDGCCYKPLEDLGLEDRFDKAIQGLNDSLDDMGVERVITACPTCLRNLQRDLKGRNVVSCYDLVKPVEPVRNGVKLVTVHDSCSDRETGTIGSAVRGVLSRYYSLVEMEHNRSNALCCGSGGLVSAYDPELAVEASRRRMDEAASTKADVVVTYCANCSNALSSQNRKNVEVRHSLELLLNVREDYNQVQDNIRNLLNGPKKELIGKLLESSA
jgi:Fe-S oxidoreductase